MHSISVLLDKLIKVMRNFGAACLLGMALVTGADVICRGLGKPIFGSEEIVSILAALVMAASLPYAHTQRSHISVEIFTKHLSPKVRRVLRLITDCLALMLFSIVSWRLFIYAKSMQSSGELSMNLELPMYLVIYVLSFAFIIFSLCLIRDLLRFFNGKEI